MHEGNFTEQIVDAVLKELKKQKVSKTEKVTVRVGEMLHLVPESVQMHFQVLTKGTPLEGAALDLREVPVRVKCGECSHTGPVEDHHMLLCGTCGSRDVEVVEGEDVTIDAVEIREEVL